jgi:hypothetical protein
MKQRVSFLKTIVFLTHPFSFSARTFYHTTGTTIGLCTSAATIFREVVSGERAVITSRGTVTCGAGLLGEELGSTMTSP